MILITGADGQVGRSLKDTQASNLEAHYANKSKLDIANLKQVESYIKSLGVTGLINVAAYNAVDKAETEKERAYLVNSQGIENLSLCAEKFKFPIVHVSTDYIFDGKKSSPYEISDAAHPLGIYGDSKLEGENKLRASAAHWTLVRTSWVYSHHGSNFVKTMLRLMTEKESLQVVNDQQSSPTWAKSLAQFLWKALQNSRGQTIHHWTDSGVTSPYDFATAIQEEAIQLGLLNKEIPLIPIRLTDYKAAAQRPKYSALSCRESYDLTAHSWRNNLISMLKDLKGAQK